MTWLEQNMNYTNQKEGECIYRANKRPCWDHLNGKKGTAKIEDGKLVFKPKKDSFGSNSYVVRSENLDYLKE